MAEQSGSLITVEAPVEAAAPVSVGADSLASFVRRLGERMRPDDVAALVAEECISVLGCRRALFAMVDSREGALAVRFTFGSGFESLQGRRIPLSHDDVPLVTAALYGRVLAIEGQALLAAGIGPEPFRDLAPGFGVVVPLVTLPLMGSGRGDLQPRCRLFMQDMPERRCFLRKEFHADPQVPEPWDVRLRTLCPECLFFGAAGVVLAERDTALRPAEMERLGILGTLAGQRARALELIERQERATEKIKKEREWLDTIMVSAADPIIVTDNAHSLVAQNKRSEELLSAGSEDSVGKRRAIGINDISFSAYLSSFAIDPKRAPRELPLVNPIEGSDLLFEAITTPAYSASGQRIGAVTVLRDITDLQKATQELSQQVYKAQRAEFQIRQERDRLDLIVKSAVEPIVVTNAANDIVLTNGVGEQLFQIGPADPPSRQRSVRNNDAVFSSFLTELLAGPDTQRKRELKLADPATDEIRTFEVTAGKIRGERGRSDAVVSVFHDVTKLQELERRRVEQKLFESEKLAATGRLAASIAHEMNNPLESIKNALYIMSTRTPSEDPAARFLDVARRECERVSGIVKQFLGFYRPAVTMLPVTLTAILEDELKLVESQLQKRRITVIKKFGPVPKVLANGDQLKQVFLNLILNAVEAMPQSGTLTLEMKHERHPTALVSMAPSVRVTIADTGTGIKPEHLTSLFEPFFTTKEERGTGLGLWVSYGIVKGHKGDIKVETHQGLGTQFHVILPAPEGEGM